MFDVLETTKNVKSWIQFLRQYQREHDQSFMNNQSNLDLMLMRKMKTAVVEQFMSFVYQLVLADKFLI